jgi:hypothetical protein
MLTLLSLAELERPATSNWAVRVALDLKFEIFADTD